MKTVYCSKVCMLGIYLSKNAKKNGVLFIREPHFAAKIVIIA